MTKQDNLSLLDMKSVAAMLKLNYETVRRLTVSGAITAIRIGRNYRYRPAAVEKFLDSREIGGVR